MNQPLRQPALAPPPIRLAIPQADNPGEFLTNHYQRVWESSMSDLPFVNPALQVEAIGFVRHRGDWLGVIVTPWFLNLFLLSGGGELWGDIPAGQRRYLTLPCGTMQFIADDDPALGPYQYCPLIAPVTALPDMAAARQSALDAMQAVLLAPSDAPPASAPQAEKPGPAPVSRRGFLRHLAGRR